MIVLATDADAPGLALAEELARRLGRERCHRVAWPQKGPDRRLAAPTAEEIADIRGRIEAMESENDPDMQEVRGAIFFCFYYFHSLKGGDWFTYFSFSGSELNELAMAEIGDIAFLLLLF